LLTFSPWLIRNFAWTHNPVFPELMPLLGHDDFDSVQVQRWELAHQAPAPLQAVAARMGALWREVALGWQFGYVILPLGLLSLALAWRQPTAWRLGGLLLILTFFWLFFTHLQSRFFILAAPLAALLVAQVDWRRLQRRLGWHVERTAAVVGMLLIAVFGAISFYGIHSRVYDRYYGAGSANGAFLQVLGREDLSWIMLKAISPDGPIPDDVTLHLVGDARAFWYPLPMSRLRYRTVFDVRSDKPDIVQAWMGPTDPARRNWLWIDPAELRRLSDSYWRLPPIPQDVRAKRTSYLETQHPKPQ